VVIEQAKGVLCERLGIAPDEAFRILRRGARSHRLRIHDLAAKVVASRETPPELGRPSSGDAA
jgi:AmiR/NasT family two-component response regulator